ncbi:hypothetical protein BZG13_10095 [Salinivibrio sp. ML323]|uniref:PilZ domain-containing protein n=1 Tax=Salinivibrio sp. ML323 TaxID=1909474 RepID=UPI0009C53E1B|nr:PilZ domain-containing protein [Salinivibrio sp. ML323]OOE57584.1 hypothetical protein BZG13_10095 [Salinivibrio sp. ML323]
MKQDDYQGLIEQLLPMSQTPKLEVLLDKLTANEPSSAKLLIKMEIRRLMTPCNRAIDLRGKVDGECHQYELNGQTHWLDDVAINHYYERLPLYNGQMTQGLWEDLHNTPNNFRVKHEQEKHTQQQGKGPVSDTAQAALLPEKLTFGRYLARSESRIHFATQVLITLNTGYEVHGVTSDLSNSGCRVRVPAAFDYPPSAEVLVQFTALGQKYQDPDLEQGLSYRIIGVDQNKESTSSVWLRLRLDTSSDAIKQALDTEMASPDFRGKQDGEDKLLTLKLQSYEQSFLHHTSVLPLYFAQDKLEYVLQTRQNRELWDYWHDSRNQPVINHIFDAKRLALLQVEGASTSQLLLYCFYVEKDKQRFFYSASPSEMSEDERHLFWQLGAKRPSWRVLKVTMSAINAGDIERLQDVSPDWLNTLKTLTHVALVQDVTHTESKDSYLSHPKPSLSSQALRRFLHQRNPVCAAQLISSDRQPQRREPRYAYRSEVSLVHPEQGALKGRLVDFSSGGLNLKLAQPFQGAKDDLVSVSLDAFVNIDPRAPLVDMPYQVIRVSPKRDNIQLKLTTEAPNTRRRQYLRRLIEHNLDKLTVLDERLPDPPLIWAMHQLLLTRLTVQPYFVRRDNGVLSVPAVGINLPPSRLHRFLERAGGGRQLSFYPVFGDKILTRTHEVTRPSQPLKELVREYFVWIDMKDDKVRAVHTFADSEFESDDARRKFIQLAQKGGAFAVLRNRMTPLAHAEQDIDATQLSSLLKRDTHKARQLEDEFVALCAYGELVDVTDEVLMRLGR